MKRLYALLTILLMAATLLIVVPPPVAYAQGAQCNQSASITVSAAASAVLVAGSGLQNIFVCGFVVTADTLATVVQFSSGTGTTCGTGTVNRGGAMRLCDECNISFRHELPIWQVPNPSNGSRTPDFCISATTGAVTGILIFGTS